MKRKPTFAPKRLNKEQRRAMLDLISEVNSENITSRAQLAEYMTEEELPEWMAEWPIYSAGENMPGAMPDSPYCLFLTDRAARGYCRELEREEGHKEGGYVSDYMPVTLLEVLS